MVVPCGRYPHALKALYGAAIRLALRETKAEASEARCGGDNPAAFLVAAAADLGLQERAAARQVQAAVAAAVRQAVVDAAAAFAEGEEAAGEKLAGAGRLLGRFPFDRGSPELEMLAASLARVPAARRAALGALEPAVGRLFAAETEQTGGGRGGR